MFPALLSEATRIPNSQAVFWRGSSLISGAYRDLDRSMNRAHVGWLLRQGPPNRKS
jgi:hypothetical protein